MTRHCMHTDTQDASDFLIGFPFRQQGQNLPFPPSYFALGMFVVKVNRRGAQ